MIDPVWVLPELVIAVHGMLLAEHGGLDGIRDKALLDSALNRPRQRLAYDTGLSIHDLAASYAWGLIKNHPFADGNKRIALSVAAIFLELNGYLFTAPEPETVVMFEQLASGDVTEDSLASWLKHYSILNPR